MVFNEMFRFDTCAEIGTRCSKIRVSIVSTKELTVNIVIDFVIDFNVTARAKPCV